MNNKETELSAIFGALNDPIRREMLSRLAHGGMTVGELSQPFKVSKPAITKHLKTLETAGLIRRRIDGREHHCTLVAKPLSAISDWVKFYERFWTQKLDRLEAYLERDDTES